DIYDPAGNSWSVGTPFVAARRNFPTNTDGSTVWLGAGYDVDGVTALSSMEIYTQSVVCGPTPTAAPATDTPPPAPTNTTAPATNRAVATVTSPPQPTDTPGPAPTDTIVPATDTPIGATATPCTINFTAVHPTDYFYQPVTYLYCHGVISGYADGTF